MGACIELYRDHVGLYLGLYKGYIGDDLGLSRIWITWTW